MTNSQPKTGIKSTSKAKFSEKQWKVFGRNVLFLREDVVWNCSQVAFGQVVGYHRAVIGNIEKGEGCRPGGTKKIAGVFGFTENDLFDPKFIERVSTDPKRIKKAQEQFRRVARFKKVEIPNAPVDLEDVGKDESAWSFENGPFAKEHSAYFPVVCTALVGDTINDLWRKAVKGEAIPFDPTWTDIKRYVLFQCPDDSMHPVISKGDRVLVDVENRTPVQGQTVLLERKGTNMLRVFRVFGADEFRYVSVNSDYPQLTPADVSVIGVVFSQHRHMPLI